MLRFENIKKIYNYKKSNEYEALHDFTEEIHKGEMVALTGTSGAGKTTLLRIAACVEEYQSGSYYLDGNLIKNLSEKERAYYRNEMIGYVMQDFGLIEDFSVLENVMLPLNFSRKKSHHKKEKAMAALQKAGMSDYIRKKCNQLSGGQKQRVAIARAIVQNPIVLLADEPTGSLDSKNTYEIMELFHTLHQAGMTLMIVTHDINIANQCERIIQIEDGYILNENNDSK